MKLVAILAFAGSATLSAPSSAQPFDAWTTGNALLATCEASDRVAQMACAAYIEGVAAGINIGSVGAGKQHFCMPRGVTIQQTRDIVIAELRNNPETRHIISTALIGGILRSAYPCVKKGKLR